ncbi:MAG: efflux RND transporter periplasmic adaptor subunit [Methylovirgula sp.]|uniref:efflux RND transporter periplasmic adaptor subunit n=1 Tax=Methylovirgula sp. TaxID=1978224 RepID=UPI0030761C98
MAALSNIASALRTAGRVVITLCIVAVALVVARELWIHYEVEPWTRDGRVRADFVEVAPDVAGLVVSVNVRDNQVVRAGDTLFVIDPSRYQIAVADAEARQADARAQLEEAERENRRNIKLGTLASSETREQSDTRVQQLSAAVDQVTAALNLARLNLSRTDVKATVNGSVTNLNLRPGDYFTPGRAALLLIDDDSFYIIGYFEETKLPRISVGDKARVQLMGETHVIKGHVESIARGIEDRERTPDSDLLANVNPTFNWVRLAQRIPVRIHVDDNPGHVRLIMGRTATVDILHNSAPGSAK